jgi:type VI secretion system protein ImpL
MQPKLLVAGLVLSSAACLGLAAWILVLSGGNPLWAAAFGLAVLGLMLVVLVIRRVHARLAARKLEHGLLAQAKAQLKSTRPDRRHETEQLQHDFQRAVRELKASRLGRAGRDALYLLPWYAMIGPSGAGKTTLLRNSGLRFPSLRGQQNVKVKGVGGTRNCDFWLTNDAVLLDTAGRWSTQDDDHHEWLGFLRLLRRHRRRKPLNGLIAAIGVGDVVNASDADIDALAQRMRDRLEEVSSELRVSIPVYLLFTKCDLLEGFVEMFAGLRATEREQILGFTVPLASAQLAAERLFEGHFDVLAETLRGAAVTRMSEERGARERQLVYAFPAQFIAMRRNLGRFVARLFESNVYQETLPLRGVYFSSGTQEGRPFCLLAEPRLDPAAVQVDQKGYFLRELFMHVIFEDSEIASASQAELRRRYRLRMALTSALSVVTLTLGVVPASAFLRSRQQLNSTAKLVAAAGGVERSGTALEPMLTPAARDLLADLTRYERSGTAWLESLGMYTGGLVLPVLSRYAANLVRAELVRPLLARDLQSMSDFGMRYAVLPHALPTPSEHDALYDALKLHLLLSAPRLTKPYAGWVAAQLSSRWQGALGRLAPEFARAYTRDTQHYPEFAFARDAEVVQRVRDALNRASPAQQALDAIVAHVATLGYDLDLPKLTGYTPALTGARRVRGAFTRRGWEAAVRELFATGAPDHVDELWVLGREESASGSPRHARLAELEELYFRAYVQEWRNFLAGVRTQSPRSVGPEALALLSELGAGEPTPLGRLFAGVHDNVRLPAQPSAPMPNAALGPTPVPETAPDLLTRIWKRKSLPAAIGGGRPAAPTEHFDASSVADAFESFTAFGVPPETSNESAPTKGRVPVPYDTYREQLAYLRDALQLHLDNPAESQQLEARIQTAMVRVRGLIDGQPATLRPILEALLWPPIRGLHDGAGRDTAAWVGQQWCSQVVAPYEQSLLGRYPFSAGGRDARIDDFDAFYRPTEGLLWKFVSATLADQVQLVGSDLAYTPKFQHGASLYSHALLEFLNRSRAISQAFYAANSGSGGLTNSRGPRGPGLEFSVRIHAASSKVDTTTFSVGGKRISYDNGPLTWQTLAWPGPDPNRGAAFSVRGHTIRAGNDMTGPWGLFRLIEAGDTQRSGDDAISVKWRLPADDLEVWIELRPARADSPWLAAFAAQERSGPPRPLRLLRGTSVPAPRRISSAQSVCTP